MPYGTDFNRPANPEEGMVRYNTTQDALEFYNGTSWNVLGDSQVIPNLVTQGLVLNLDASDSSSYSGSGNTWADLSSKGNDFTLSSAVYSNLGGGSFEFGAGKAAYITGNSDFAPGTGDYSLSAWVYPTTLNSVHGGHVFWTQSVTGYNYYMALVTNSGNAGYTIDWNNYVSTNSTSITGHHQYYLTSREQRKGANRASSKEQRAGSREQGDSTDMHSSVKTTSQLASIRGQRHVTEGL